MSISDQILLLNAIATSIAVLLAPLFALVIGGWFQKRSELKKQKLTILGVLISLRHDQLASDAVRSLNLIDVVFADDNEVREAWTKYFAVINNGALNNPVGWSLQAEKRHELLMAMVKALNLKGKISSADLLRTYTPAAVGNQSVINYWEQQIKLKEIQDTLTRYGIPITFVPSVLVQPTTPTTPPPPQAPT